MSSTLGVGALGVYPLAGLWERAAPSVVVTSPTGALETTSATLAFTYSSPISATQVSYRYQIRSQDGTTVLYDSGTVVSAASSGITIPYVLAGGSSYQIWVRASDTYDTSAWALSSFSCEASDVSAFTPNEQVGSVYEIGINGVGYMLADDPEHPVRRQIQQLNPPRLVTSDTPFTESFDRYTFVGQADFSGGADQKFRERPDSDGTRFWRSEGLDVFRDDGGVTLLKRLDPSTNASTRSVVEPWQGTHLISAGSNLAIDDASPWTITGAGTIVDLVVAGSYWYATDGSSIWRNTTGADPVTAWSTIDADLIEWCIDRLAALYDDGAGNLCVTTLDNAGAEEVAGGRFKYPDTVDIPAMAAGDGYLWFALNDPSGVSNVMFWQVGSSDTYAANGLTMPPGEQIKEMYFYLGNLFLRTKLDTRISIWRCVPSEGRLTPQKVMDYTEASALAANRGFAGWGEYVGFAWSGVVDDGWPGIGIIDLETGGWSTGPYVPSGHFNYPVVDLVANSNGWAVITKLTTNYYLHTQTTNYLAEGQIDLSLSDMQSGLPKVFDSIELQFDPLPADATIAVSYTTDGGSSYVSAGDTITQDGQQTASFDISARARSLGVRVTITSGTTQAVLNVVQLRLHASAPADQVMVLPINCSDELYGLNGQPLPNELSAIDRYRSLEQLVGTRVLFQDTDWPVTDSTSVWELIGVESDLHGYRSSKLNHRVESGRAVVTLRRSAS